MAIKKSNTEIISMFPRYDIDWYSEGWKEYISEDGKFVKFEDLEPVLANMSELTKEEILIVRAIIKHNDLIEVDGKPYNKTRYEAWQKEKIRLKDQETKPWYKKSILLGVAKLIMQIAGLFFLVLLLGLAIAWLLVER